MFGPSDPGGYWLRNLSSLIHNHLAARGAAPAVDMRADERQESPLSDRRSSQGPNSQSERHVRAEPFEQVTVPYDPSSLHGARAERTGCLNRRRKGMLRLWRDLPAQGEGALRMNRWSCGRLEVNDARDDIGSPAKTVELASRLVRVHEDRPVATDAIEEIAGGTRFGWLGALEHGCVISWPPSSSPARCGWGACGPTVRQRHSGCRCRLQGRL